MSNHSQTVKEFNPAHIFSSSDEDSSKLNSISKSVAQVGLNDKTEHEQQQQTCNNSEISEHQQQQQQQQQLAIKSSSKKQYNNATTKNNTTTTNNISLNFVSSSNNSISNKQQQVQSDDSSSISTHHSDNAERDFRKAQSEFCRGQHAESLATLAYCMSKNQRNEAIFNKFIETVRQSLFWKNIEPKYNLLEKKGLHREPFTVAAAVGQEILNLDCHQAAVVILESAIKIGTNDLKLRGSVFSSLSAACFALKDHQKALYYIEKDREIEEEFNDAAGLCRVYGNLGCAYFLMREYKQSLDWHRKQLNLASKSKLFEQAAVALNAIGHVHVARNDYQSALTSHTRCLEIQREMKESNFKQIRELISIGHILAMMGDYDAAEEKYNQSINVLNNLQNLDDVVILTIMLHFNLAYISIKKRACNQAQVYYGMIIKESQKLSGDKGKIYEARALSGQGHAYRTFEMFAKAKPCFERQLELAEATKDQAGISQALCNLAIICQHFKEYEKAYKLFERNLKLVKDDLLLSAYGYSYMGSVSFSMGKLDDAISYYSKSSEAFQDLGCETEVSSINSNLRFVRQRMAHSDMTMRSTESRQKRSPLNFA